MDKWISVENSLPKLWEPIIVCVVKDQEISISRYAEWIDRNMFECEMSSYPKIVTHWMPLPETPEIK